MEKKREWKNPAWRQQPPSWRRRWSGSASARPFERVSPLRGRARPRGKWEDKLAVGSRRRETRRKCDRPKRRRGRSASGARHLSPSCNISSRVTPCLPFVPPAFKPDLRSGGPCRQRPALSMVADRRRTRALGAVHRGHWHRKSRHTTAEICDDLLSFGFRVSYRPNS